MTTNIQPIHANDSWIVDSDNKVVGVQTKNTAATFGNVTATTNPVTGGVRLSAGGFFQERQGGEIIAVVGDSITEGAMGTFRFTQTANGYQKNTQWCSPSPSTVSWTNINVTGYTLAFIEKVAPTIGCANNDSYVIAYNGVDSISVNFAGEGFGTPVNVTTGGWFTAYSASGAKGFHFTVRWDWRPPTACQDSGTLSGSLTVQSTGVTAGGWASLALLGLGGASNRDIYTFGISSDPLNVIKRRSVQIANGLNPDIVLIMASINSFTTIDISDLVAMVKMFNDGGSYVVVSTLLPIGTLTVNTAQQLAAINTKILRLPISNPSLRVDIFDANSLVSNPRVTSGLTILNAGEFDANLIHPSLAAIMRMTPALSEIIKSQIPPRRPSLTSITNAWDATYNPDGNLLGSAGKFIGSSGSKGTNPVPTGSVPAGWEDLEGGSASAWASVVYTGAGDGGAFARTDGVPGNWSRLVCTTAGVSGSARQMRYTVPNNFLAGRLYRIKGTVRISSASYLKIFNVGMSLYSTAGRRVDVYALFNCGYAATSLASPIADTGALYLTSDPVNIPNDFTGLAYLNVQFSCGAGGSITLDLDDFVVEPV